MELKDYDFLALLQEPRQEVLMKKHVQKVVSVIKKTAEMAEDDKDTALSTLVNMIMFNASSGEEFIEMIMVADLVKRNMYNFAFRFNISRMGDVPVNTSGGIFEPLPETEEAMDAIYKRMDTVLGNLGETIPMSDALAAVAKGVENITWPEMGFAMIAMFGNETGMTFVDVEDDEDPGHVCTGDC